MQLKWQFKQIRQKTNVIETTHRVIHSIHPSIPSAPAGRCATTTPVLINYVLISTHQWVRQTLCPGPLGGPLNRNPSTNDDDLLRGNHKTFPCVCFFFSPPHRVVRVDAFRSSTVNDSFFSILFKPPLLATKYHHALSIGNGARIMSVPGDWEEAGEKMCVPHFVEMFLIILFKNLFSFVLVCVFPPPLLVPFIAALVSVFVCIKGELSGRLFPTSKAFFFFHFHLVYSLVFPLPITLFAIFYIVNHIFTLLKGGRVDCSARYNREERRGRRDCCSDLCYSQVMAAFISLRLHLHHPDQWEN